MEGNKLQEETSIKGAELETELVSIKQKLAEKEMEGNKVQEETSIKAAELESELVSIKQKLAEKELEGKKLQEENERLALQTQKISEAAPVNGHSEASSSGEDWREKFESLQQEHETI